jgi:hypothetical protein
MPRAKILSLIKYKGNNYGVFLSDNVLYMKVKRTVYLSGPSDFKTGSNNCAAQVGIES